MFAPIFRGSSQPCTGVHRGQTIDAACVRFDLTDLRPQLAGTLSGGQRQRLALAAATLHRPELLLLDEPTSAVDPETRRHFWDSLYELAAEGTTILVSTHFVRMVRSIVLRGGTLADISREIWPLAAFFAVTMVAAMLRFRKRLD